MKTAPTFGDSLEQDDVHVDIARERAQDRKFNNSLSRGFDILRAFKPGAGPMGNADLSSATGIPTCVR